MKFSRKQKRIFFYFVPTIIALAIVISLILWVSAVKYTIWKVAITWGAAILSIDIVIYLNSKIIKKSEVIAAEEKLLEGIADSVLNSEKINEEIIKAETIEEKPAAQSVELPLPESAAENAETEIKPIEKDNNKKAKKAKRKADDNKVAVTEIEEKTKSVEIKNDDDSAVEDAPLIEIQPVSEIKDDEKPIDESITQEKPEEIKADIVAEEEKAAKKIKKGKADKKEKEELATPEVK